MLASHHRFVVKQPFLHHALPQLALPTQRMSHFVDTMSVHDLLMQHCGISKAHAALLACFGELHYESSW